MKLERFKEKDNKRTSIIVFTIVCILLVSGVILYRTFAIFEVKTNQNVINGQVQGIGDLEFAFYKDNQIVKEVPKKDEEYSLDTSSSYCIDLLSNQKVSNVNWDNERWGPYLSNLTTTKTKCYLYFKQIYKEITLNGAIPDLGNGRLVPVNILEEQPTGITIQNMNGSYGGKVVKADITDKWYSYIDKEWANAVILRDGKTDDYAPGDEILESDIESYFVWIPRYSYILQEEEETYNEYASLNSIGQVKDVNDFYDKKENKGKDSYFEIRFETKDKGNTSVTTKNEYLTHPAFTSFDSNGFWAGKFETGFKGADNESAAQVNELKVEKVIIKPNVYSWRFIQPVNAFYTSYDYKRELESHMMKNMEWGAVAYLTQSKYGRCNDGICTEVRINNNSNFVTGYSAKMEPTCGFIGANETCNKYEENVVLNQDGEDGYSYYNSKSVASSTTGNYSGVYDMAGGSWEHVMGVMQGTDNGANTPASGKDFTYNSGFNGPYSYCTSNGGKEDCNNITSHTSGKSWPS